MYMYDIYATVVIIMIISALVALVSDGIDAQKEI